MNYSSEDENYSFRHPADDQIHKLWGELNGPGYDIHFKSPYANPNLALNKKERNNDISILVKPPSLYKDILDDKSGISIDSSTSVSAKYSHIDTDPTKYISTSWQEIPVKSEPTKSWLDMVVTQMSTLGTSISSSDNISPSAFVVDSVTKPLGVSGKRMSAGCVLGSASWSVPSTSWVEPPATWDKNNTLLDDPQPSTSGGGDTSFSSRSDKSQRSGLSQSPRRTRPSTRKNYDALIEKAMQSNVLGPPPPLYYDDIVLPPIQNKRVFNTINMHQYLRIVSSLLENYKESDDPPYPPELPDAPEPIKTNEIEVLPVLLNPDQPIIITDESELQRPRRIRKSTVLHILRRCAVIILAQVGFKTTTNNALQIFVEGALQYLDNLVKELCLKRGPGKTTRAILEELLMEHGGGSLDELNDYYIEKVINYESQMYEQCQELQKKYMSVVEIKKQKREVQSLFNEIQNEDIREIIPQLHVPDRPEGIFEDLPDLAPGMQILQTLEQEAAALHLSTIEDYIHSPNVLQGSGQLSFQLPALSDLSTSPSTSPGLISALPSLQSLSGTQHYNTPGASDSSLSSGYPSSSFFDFSDLPGPSNLCTGYAASEPGLPDFANSPATSVATVGSSPGTPAPIKRRKF